MLECIIGQYFSLANCDLKTFAILWFNESNIFQTPCRWIDAVQYFNWLQLYEITGNLCTRSRLTLWLIQSPTLNIDEKFHPVSDNWLYWQTGNAMCPMCGTCVLLCATRALLVCNFNMLHLNILTLFVPRRVVFNPATQKLWKWSFFFEFLCSKTIPKFIPIYRIDVILLSVHLCTL